MNKEFIPYEQALALKELGFDEPCFGYYDIKDDNLQLFSDNLQDASCNSDLKYDDFKHCTAPLYHQAFRWFREKYDLEGVIQQAEDFKWYKWKISQYNEDGKKYVADWYEYKTYEEAELACLKKLIEIAKNK
jgi:thymidylate synthase